MANTSPIFLNYSNSNLKGNKLLWKFVKSQRHDRTGINTLETSDGIAATPISKAEALSRTFQSAFAVEYQSSLPTLPESIHPSIEEITITEPSVLHFYAKLEVQTAF